jgi:hypothetical protein
MKASLAMKEFIKQNHKILGIIGSLCLAGIIIAGLIFGPLNIVLPRDLRERLGYLAPTSEPYPISVDLFVDFNGAKEVINLTVHFKANQTATAYSILLQANLSVSVNEEYSFGVYITGIEGIKQDAVHYWWYLIDGENGLVAADKCNLRTLQAKAVSWIYKTN